MSRRTSWGKQTQAQQLLSRHHPALCREDLVESLGPGRHTGSMCRSRAAEPADLPGCGRRSAAHVGADPVAGVARWASSRRGAGSANSIASAVSRPSGESGASRRRWTETQSVRSGPRTVTARAMPAKWRVWPAVPSRSSALKPPPRSRGAAAGGEGEEGGAAARDAGHAQAELDQELARVGRSAAIASAVRASSPHASRLSPVHAAHAATSNRKPAMPAAPCIQPTPGGSSGSGLRCSVKRQ